MEKDDLIINKKINISDIYKNLDLAEGFNLEEKIDLNLLHMLGINFFSVAFRVHKTGKSKTNGADNSWFNFIENDEFLSQFYLKKDKIWGEIYKFILTCNENNIGKQKILLYSTFDYTSKFYQEIELRRRKYSLKNGVMLITNHENYLSCLTFGSNSRYFSELDFVIKNRNIIEEIKEQSILGIKDTYGLPDNNKGLIQDF